MIIVKLTILLTMVCVLLKYEMKVWAKNNPPKVYVEDYPTWIYVALLLMFLDVIAIFASVIWFLFFYL